MTARGVPPGRRLGPRQASAEELQPRAELRAELSAILADDPTLESLHLAPSADVGAIDVRVIRSRPSAFFVVRVPIPNRDGLVWASRLPGSHAPSTEEELSALEAMGIRRVFCLVPSFALEGLHGASQYLAAARRRFGDRFHQVEILDHDVPARDAEFDEQVAACDRAVSNGEQVLVHCIGGCGRTGMFTACVMIRAGDAPRDAIRRFQERRRCGPETPEQTAFVVRYARRLAPSVSRAAPATPPAPILRLSRGADGEPVRLACGGLAHCYVGRFRVPGRPWRRVVVKRFVYAVSDDDARRMQATADDLVRAGVRLPKMHFHRLEDGIWVQVTPLFGSIARGSKFMQPSQFHKTFSPTEQRFAVEQLTRVASAGYRPSIDLFLVFREREKGIIPMDLDLIVPERDVSRRAAELVKRLVQIGIDEADRDRLLEVAFGIAPDDLSEAIRRILGDANGPYARLWRLL